MVLKVSATVEGLQRLDGLFSSMDRGLNNLREPLNEANKYMRSEIDKNYENQGQTFGDKWEKLSPTYARRKARETGNKPLLVRTGKMKRSFRSRVGSKKAVIDNPTSYFKYHQSNKPRKKLPRRVMMEIGRTQQTEINRFFTKYLNKIKNG